MGRLHIYFLLLAGLLTGRRLALLGRRWQGLSLAVWSAAQSLEGLDPARQQGLGGFAFWGTTPFQMEAGSLMVFGHVRRLALATEAGRAAMLQMFESMLVSACCWIRRRGESSGPDSLIRRRGETQG